MKIEVFELLDEMVNVLGEGSEVVISPKQDRSIEIRVNTKIEGETYSYLIFVSKELRNDDDVLETLSRVFKLVLRAGSRSRHP